MEILRFERLSVPGFLRWQRESGEKPYPHWAKVSPDAAGAKSLTLLIAPYRPYLPTAEGLELSAFYVASNALHRETGIAALNLPLKPLIAGYGIGAYGRCGVTAVPGIGTRFAAAVLACPEEPDPRWEWREDRPFSPECASCAACVSSCPAGALSGSGRVNMDRCLRAQAQYQEPGMEDAHKALIGSSVWGCEACQNVCPRNRRVAPVAMPRELEDALRLSELLAGNVEKLAPWIGGNYARKGRMQARACLIAANLKRYDLIGDVRNLLDSPVAPVRECAAWALEKLETEEKNYE